MGRHYKGVADILALFHRAAEVERQWAAYAATLPDDDKRQLFRQWWAEAEAAQAAGRYVRSCPGYLRGLTCGARKKGWQAMPIHYALRQWTMQIPRARDQRWPISGIPDKSICRQ